MNPISFCDGDYLMAEKGAVNIVYLDFSEVYDTVSHNILLEKVSAHGLAGWHGRWDNVP